MKHGEPVLGPERRRYRWPAHLVTAPHTMPPKVGVRQPRLPYGEWHARSPGSLQTVCGMSAVGWQFFWTLNFWAAGPKACPECVHVLVEHEGV